MRMYARAFCFLAVMVTALFILSQAAMAADAKKTVIPAKLAIAPVVVQPVGLQTSGNVALKNGELTNVSPQLAPLVAKSMGNYLQTSGMFPKVVTINEQILPTSASVAEIAQAGREAEADVVLECKVIAFDGSIDYGFKTQLQERLVIELVLYETATARRLWHGKQTVDETKRVYLGPWDDETTVGNYLSMLSGQTFPSALSVLVAKIGTDMADYKPPMAGTVAAAAADFVSDVDRVPRTATAVRKNAYAVVIGIEKYRDLPQAEYTTRDAKTMKEYLVRVMGYPQENVITLLDDRATKGDIEGYLGTWLKNNVEKNSDVVVYYAGHGAPNPVTGEPYLIPYDGNPAFLEASAVPLKKIYQMLASLDAKDVLLIMDACFSGGGGRSVMAKGGRPIAISVENPLLASKNIVVLSAAKGTEISSSYPEKRHGLFTYFLLKGLQGDADITGNHVIDIEKLYNYLTPKVKKIAREHDREQTPVITPDLDVLGTRARIPLVAPAK